MTWYEDLYVGESIVHKTNKIKWKIRRGAGQVNIYVISLASNPQNLLDIIPSWELLQKGYPKKEIYVVGLARGYKEALDVAAAIVDDVYRQTGGFDVRSFLGKKSRTQGVNCQRQKGHGA
jgi:hypothetical protein